MVQLDPAIVTVVFTTLFAAAVAFVFGQIAEWRKNVRDFRHRWDDRVFSAAQEFVASTRRLAHIASDTPNDSAVLASAHAEVRSTSQKLMVIADTELAILTRKVQREAYAVVKTANGEPDPRPDAKPAEIRYHESLEKFYVGLREYLRLDPHPSDLIAD